MTRKKSTKNASPTETIKAGVGLILLIAFMYVATILFYVFLIMGLLMVVVPFFTPTEGHWMVVGFGALLIAVAFGGNLLGNRLSTGTWKITWPSNPGDSSN